MKLSFARIATRDVARLAAFYRDVTGIPPAGSDEYLEFATPTGGLAIVSQARPRAPRDECHRAGRQSLGDPRFRGR
jgi:hypothetical protein